MNTNKVSNLHNHFPQMKCYINFHELSFYIDPQTDPSESITCLAIMAVYNWEHVSALFREVFEKIKPKKLPTQLHEVRKVA